MENKHKNKAPKEQLPKILKKFDKQKQRKKGLYTKAFEIMSAITSVLKENVNDFSATAYFTSIVSMYQRKLQDNLSQEALAYCFSAILSMLDLAIIQNQHATIYKIINEHLLAANIESPQVGKYGIIACQFLLHSKTEAQWNGNDEETDRAFIYLLNGLTDKRVKVQKQGQKSLCILFQNKQIEKLVKPLMTVQHFVTNIFTQHSQGKNIQNQQRVIQVLNFLAAALQLMPISLCCDLDMKIFRLSHIEDSLVKTHAYLTLEVLFASRRFQNPEHVEQLLKYLLENQEVISTYKNQTEHEEMRVVSYIQSTTQVMMNLATSGIKGNDVLKYVSACFSVFCEYFMNTSRRISNATFSALRLIIQQCLKREYFLEKQSQSRGMTSDILNLDALSLNEEIINMRKGGQAGFTSADKVIIHLRYLLTSRFEDCHDLSLKLMRTFIQTVGSAVKEAPELLNVVANLHVPKETYKTWTSCIGAFLQAIRENNFFTALPLNLLDYDMNSLTFAQDSRTYLIPVIKQYLTTGDLAFFVQYFLPIILALDQRRQQELTVNKSDIKAKKYETLMVQLWELLPNFCHYNSSKLSSAFATLIGYIEPMINQNILGLRTLALRVFSELISHCRTTSEVTAEIKATRLGLQRICMDYVDGLSKLYNSQHDASQQDKKQILKTLQDFSSIAKSVKLSNVFLQAFATLLFQFTEKQMKEDQVSRNLDVLVAMMEKVKLKKENYMNLMKGLKAFIDNPQTQKHGYKLLAKIIEKYELENISELFQIQKELNPLLKGQASKQRLMLMQSYVHQMHKFINDPANLQSIVDLLKVMIIELITAFTHSNTKIRKLAEDIIKSIFDIVMHMKAIPQLFQMLLVGFAGTKAVTQSATIKSLLLLIKINYSKKEEENSLDFQDQSFQDFLRKVTKIILLFLKDKSSGNQLHRSVLKFVKTAVSFITTESLKGEIAETIAVGMLSLSKHKNDELVKKILSKLIKKLSLNYVRSIVPKEHQALIDYVERERRKRVSKQKRDKLKALLGQEDKVEEKPVVEEDSDVEMEEEEVGEQFEKYSLDSEGESESESEEEDARGRDHLMTDDMDIPRVDNIPVVSKLAKEQQMQAKSMKQRVGETKDRVARMIEADEEEFESHFVENPFIKIRERTQQKSLNSKQILSHGQLQADEDKEDIVLVKESGKFIIKDFEEDKNEKELKKKLKRTRLDAGIQTSSESESSEEEDDTNDTGALKQKMKLLRKKQKVTDSKSHAIQKSKPSQQMSALKQKRQKIEQGGHIVKYSGTAYKSEKGQGDVLKAGKYEPFAYIQLNPKMLNKRNKAKAVKSFEGVVSHGKKTDKRSGKKTEGLLSGMGFKKQQ